MRGTAQAGLFLETCRVLARRGRAGQRRVWRKLIGTERRSKGNTSEVLFTYPAYLRPGDPERGRDFLSGDYTFKGGVVRDPHKTLFQVTPPSLRWQASAYGFDWLTHLIAEGSDSALNLAQELINHFISARLDRKPAARQPHIIARRLMRWCLYFGIVRDRLDIVDKSALLTQAERDASLLADMLDTEVDGHRALEAAAGLAIAALWLSDLADHMRSATDYVTREMKRAILADGGMANRSPETLSHCLADLSALHEGLMARNIDPPTLLTNTLPRMRNMLVFLSASDGALTKFHGGLTRTAREISPLLPSKSELHSFSYSAKSGFHRLRGGHTHLLIDTGSPARGAAAQEAHLSPLAIELSHGGDRIFESCGANRANGNNWHLATRGLAAHSGPTILRGTQDPFLTQGLAAQIIGARLTVPPFDIRAHLTEDEAGTWLETHHNLFVASHGLTTSRTLFMSADGQDIRGEDIFAPADPEKLRPGHIAIRFHLPPNIEPTLQAGGQSCLLITHSGRGWQFRARARHEGQFLLEPSISVNARGQTVKSQQIVLTGPIRTEATGFNWAVKFVGQIKRRK